MATSEERARLLVEAQILALRAVCEQDPLKLDEAVRLVPDDLTMAEWWGMQVVLLEVVRDHVRNMGIPDGGYWSVRGAGDVPPVYRLLAQVIGKWLTGDPIDQADAMNLALSAPDDVLGAFGSELVLFTARIVEGVR